MRRAYILIYSSTTGGRETVRKWANKDPNVLTWRFDMPNSFYLISESTADDLAKSLRAFTGPRGRFLIAELGENRQGWLPPATWYLLKNKANKPKKDD